MCSCCIVCESCGYCVRSDAHDAACGGDAEHNKVTVTFEWPADKWMGFESWKMKIGTLLRMADLLGLDDGRPTMTVVTERDDDDDDG